MSLQYGRLIGFVVPLKHLFVEAMLYSRNNSTDRLQNREQDWGII